jgi:hypothetical protein
VQAQYNLGQIYARNTESASAAKKALHWMQKAADGGEFAAQYNIGMAHYYGQLGLPQDEAKCEDYMQLAANGGNVMAMGFLSALYTEWVTEAAERGDHFNVTRFGARQKKWEKLATGIHGDEDLMQTVNARMTSYVGKLPGEQTHADGKVKSLFHHTEDQMGQRTRKKQQLKLQRALKQLKKDKQQQHK